MSLWATAMAIVVFPIPPGAAMVMKRRSGRFSAISATWSERPKIPDTTKESVARHIRQVLNILDPLINVAELLLDRIFAGQDRELGTVKAVRFAIQRPPRRGSFHRRIRRQLLG